MAGIEIHVDGIGEVQAALTAAVARLDAATRVATVAAASLAEAATKDQLRKSSHQRGTPTPADPGQPPALVSGNLMRSIAVKGPSGGGGLYTAAIGPTAVYGRIQELGGATGRNHATNLPPRPYVEPARKQVEPAIEATYIAAWRAVLE